jgi:CrcB protein
MLNVLWIALGGALGSVLRYSFSHLLPYELNTFPKATFISNVLASLIVGFVAGMLLSKFHDEHWLKYFVLIGFCGGFSTFSTYAFELFKLNTEGAYALALFYALSAILFSVMAIFCGLWLSKFLS